MDQFVDALQKDFTKLLSSSNTDASSNKVYDTDSEFEDDIPINDQVDDSILIYFQGVDNLLVESELLQLKGDNENALLVINEAMNLLFSSLLEPISSLKVNEYTHLGKVILFIQNEYFIPIISTNIERLITLLIKLFYRYGYVIVNNPFTYVI